MGNFSAGSPLQTSKSSDWRTPDHVLERSRLVFAGAIGLDPCASADPEHWFAAKNYNPHPGLQCMAADGLVTPWGDGSVFMNPPYGRGIEEWTRRARQAWLESGAEVIGLLPSRTDTRWFQDCWKGSAICFWKGRLTFEGAPAPAPFPSAVVYWGDRVRRFDAAFAECGEVVTL